MTLLEMVNDSMASSAATVVIDIQSDKEPLGLPEVGFRFILYLHGRLCAHITKKFLIIRGPYKSLNKLFQSMLAQ